MRVKTKQENIVEEEVEVDILVVEQEIGLVKDKMVEEVEDLIIAKQKIAQIVLLILKAFIHALKFMVLIWWK